MCGIVGFQGDEADEQVARMNAAQAHRGPDGAGSHAVPELGFAMAMRRLAIIDIAGGRQPLVSADGRYALVFNGEIFNAPELRRELEARGIRFASDHSDTETLFRLLVADGPQAVSRLNGMFAFAFLDREAGTLALGRDRFGIKPLHYAECAGGFAFASEIKSLLALNALDAAPDPAAAAHFLTLHYVPGETTAFRSIRRVPPGTVLERDLRSGATRLTRFWRLSYAPDHRRSRAEWREAIRETLRGAVRRWAWADVPVAVSLSGGLDSSAVAAFAALEGIPVSAVSLGFDGPDEAPWNELPLAREVAARWNIPHEEIVLRPEALIERLPAMVAALDEPYAGGLPSWFVFEAMARRVKVGLTGVGGDEMFGNYGKWLGLERRWFGRFGRRPAGAVSRELFAERLVGRYYYADAAARSALLVDPPPVAAATETLLFERFAAAVQAGQGLRDAWAITDIETQLADEFLMMTDRFSMAHGLEARTPFLDNEFVDLVRTIPETMRTAPGDLKGLLREAVAPLLPAALLNAPKRGFVLPLANWLRRQLRGLVEERLAEPALRRQRIFRPEAVAAITAAHFAGENRTAQLWPLLMYQLWIDSR